MQKAIVECIKQVVEDESGYAAIENLKHHVNLYFGKGDENSTAEDEARAAELIQAITKAASGGQYTAEMQSLVEELNMVKATIEEKKSKQTAVEKSSERIQEILTAIDELKDTPISFGNEAIQQIVDCIKVISKDEILIIFKGGFERSVALS